MRYERMFVEYGEIYMARNYLNYLALTNALHYPFNK